MKEVKAIIQPHMLSKVMKALHALPHFPGMTVSDVRGQGRGRGAGGAFKITEDSIDYHCKVMLDIFCADDAAESLAAEIQKAAHTGLSGDGCVVITSLDRVVRIRTGEMQEKAV
jgi:nitrogen regulatory protein P-II 1